MEFALIFPIFILMFMATIEFGLAFNAVLNVNYASRNATLLAAEAGNSAGADCVILQSVEDDIGTPATDAGIQSVDIYWADPDGSVKSGKINHYVRSGSTTCSYNDGTDLTVPYTLTVGGYLDTINQGLNKGLSDVNDKKAALQLRLATYSDMLTKQFNAMDAAVAALKSTQNFITQAFNSINGTKTGSSSSG